MKVVTLEISGTTPLLCHNVQLADPDSEVVDQIKEITRKRTKTKEDRQDIARLEWFGGLYLNAGQVVFPTAAIKRCVANAGKITKQGSTIARAVHFLDFQVPIAHDGPKDIEKLFANKAYTFRACVGIQGKKCVRVRPQFPKWALVVKVGVLENVLDLKDFENIVALAGMAEGLGDGRAIGFGRFTAKVKAA